jgi:hypothetical protein
MQHDPGTDKSDHPVDMESLNVFINGASPIAMSAAKKPSPGSRITLLISGIN